MLAQHVDLTEALKQNTAALSGAIDPVREKIRARLAAATGNTTNALGDGLKVIQMLAGGPSAAGALTGDINQEFWPRSKVNHITFDQIKDLSIGQLIDLIRSKLGSRK